ncbi:hypothetical protein E8E14_012740 [Neopestalotiopsis sp. 37M]|nr:hypothetical protein E8E14_012740 [Neopestalotiopsis sp. 37M]
MQSLEAVPVTPTRASPPGTTTSTTSIRVKKEEGPGDDDLGRVQPANHKRTVCDNCRRRRIRCDGKYPCQQCMGATLTCKRDHVPRKRGPKRGHGRVINELRAQENKQVPSAEPTSGSDIDAENYNSTTTSAVASAAPSPPAQLFVPWTAVTSDPRKAPEPKGPFTSDVYQPRIRDYRYLIPKCVDLYYEHMYPIMPLVYMPAIRTIIARDMTCSEKNLIYALSALTSFHMAGKSLAIDGQPPWDEVGRFFLDECVSVRHRYDFLEDTSLFAVISSFWLSTSFFEINQSRKSWFYLREALTLATEIRLQDDKSYVDLPPEETLCRQRVYWILFVTERSFAILRNKPLTLRKTPSLPTTKHSYEAPDIHVGFMKLVSIYVPLDESFVNAWNDGSDPRVSATTYLHLQRLLAQPLDFLRPKKKSPTPPAALFPTMDSPQDDDGDDPDPTSIQKADLMITQQWLRLIVWQSSFRQGLLSTGANDQSFHFSFPLSIARDTASILQSLPSRAVEVHGMGIFEKIFEIGTWCINVMGAYDSGTPNPSRPFGGASDGVAGMDYVGGELSLFGHSGRSGAVLDPLEFFIKTLSSSPNSKTMYADKLLMFAEQTPGGMRTNLSPVMASFGGLTRENSWSTISGTIGEVIKDEADGDVYCDADLTTEPMMMDTDRGMSLSELGMTSGFGRVNSASTDELALNIVTTRSSGHSTLDGGPLSAGLSNAFSDLSTSGDEYSLHAAYANDILPGINMPGLNSMNSTAAWTSSDPDDERKRAQERSSTTNPNAKAERVLGIW